MAALSQGAAELCVTEGGVPIGLVRAASLMARLINPRHG